ncbi:hypothetical protein I4U23_016874 [Adineta vaga]|nr:hypothetical protein I4U23_016874 [Adineta vaga]
MSTYATNFEYIVPWEQIQETYVPIQAKIYNNTCSCGLHSSCTSDAKFIKSDSLEEIFIKGLKMGCIPSESFRASTLECFYDPSCIDLIQEYTIIGNWSNVTDSLSINNSRFSMNTTIDELINNLFIEEWKKLVNYSSYFQQCSPFSCSYTYIQQFNVLRTLTILLGLQGGLTILLEWICPKIIQIIFKLNQYRKKRINTIQPISHIETKSIQNINTNIHNIRTNISSRMKFSLKFVLICILLLFILAALILFSLNIIREEKRLNVHSTASLTSSSTTNMDSIFNTLTNTITDMTTKYKHCPCPLNFERISKNRNPFEFEFSIHVVADFNGDNWFDIASISTYRSCLKVSLSNGDGTFKPEITSLEDFHFNVIKMVVADFDRDTIPDIVGIRTNPGFVAIAFGIGDGTFK